MCLSSALNTCDYSRCTRLERKPSNFLSAYCNHVITAFVVRYFLLSYSEQMTFSEELKWLRWQCPGHFKLIVSCSMARQAFPYRIEHLNRFSQTENGKLHSENNRSCLCLAFIRHWWNNFIEVIPKYRLGWKVPVIILGKSFCTRHLNSVQWAEQKFHIQRGGNKSLFVLGCGDAWERCTDLQVRAQRCCLKLISHEDTQTESDG